MTSNVCEYLLFIKGEPQFIMYARKRHAVDDALNILNHHQGRNVARADIAMCSQGNVPKRLWTQCRQRTAGWKART